jgi:hypothetical protein
MTSGSAENRKIVNAFADSGASNRDSRCQKWINPSPKRASLDDYRELRGRGNLARGMGRRKCGLFRSRYPISGGSNSFSGIREMAQIA